MTQTATVLALLAALLLYAAQEPTPQGAWYAERYRLEQQ